MQLDCIEKPVRYRGAFGLYKEITQDGEIPALLMESRTVNLAYGRHSIIAANLALKITGKNERFRIEALTEQGVNLLSGFSHQDFPFADAYSQNADCVEGSFRRAFNPNLDLSQRIRDISVSKFLRSIMKKFQTENKYAGLYGAFAYDFVRNFEDIGHRHDMEPGEDFVLYLPTSIIVFDDVRDTGMQYNLAIEGDPRSFKTNHLGLNGTNGRFDSMSEREFEQKVRYVTSDIRNGRFMQCVLSRSTSIPLIEHPLHSYQRLREINPSPYCFFFNFGDGELLYGSSPEIHAVVENGTLVIRPLAGTIMRSRNPMEDSHLRIKLLTDQKERREHMMLVDLARNDVHRLCDPHSVEITDILTVEQYPNLYHLASGVRGNLRIGFDAIDAILTTIPSGTLSGAPKLEAMKAIEELENTRRGFYGGAVGYLTFNGDLNTGITIRSVHVNNGYSRVQAGAGIVSQSNPEEEANEVRLKLEKPMRNLEAKVR